MRVIERNDDVLLLAETHSNKTETDLALKLLATHSWCSTASPAQLTQRSELGTAGGVLAAIKNFYEGRALSTCIDTMGRFTSNAFLDGRLLILLKIEILCLSGYWLY